MSATSPAGRGSRPSARPCHPSNTPSNCSPKHNTNNDTPTTQHTNNTTTPTPTTRHRRQKQKDYFWRWTHYLKWYAGEPTSKIFTGGDSFDGCGGNGANELDYVEFSAPYNWGGDRWVCLDGVVLQ